MPYRAPPSPRYELTSLIQLRFASGSLHQYLNVRYASKLASSSTVDNVESILSEFIPPGAPCSPSTCAPPFELSTGYETDEKTFLDIVERDATEFKPLGNKIYSYQRLSPSSQGKGKGIASTTDLDPEREDVIEYEVYHVSTYLPWLTFRLLTLTIRPVNMGYPGIQGVPPKNANIYPSLYRGRFVHRRG